MRSNYKSPYYMLLIASGFRLRDSGFCFTTVYRARRVHVSCPQDTYIYGVSSIPNTKYQILTTKYYSLATCYSLLATIPAGFRIQASGFSYTHL